MERRFILLRRLYLSMDDLAKNKKIIDIAMHHEYSSQEACSRALKIFSYQSGNKFPVQSVVKLTLNGYI